MLNKTTLAWLAMAIARGVAWVLSSQLAITAVEAKQHGEKVGAATIALVVVGVTVYSSLKGRKALLNAPPPPRE